MIIFWSTLIDIFCLKLDFALNQINTACNYILRRKQGMKSKQRNTFSIVSDADTEESMVFFMRSYIFLFNQFHLNCPHFAHCNNLKTKHYFYSYSVELAKVLQNFWITKTNIWCSNQYTEAVVQMFFKIGVLKNFSTFTGNYLCRSLFLIVLQVWKLTTL